MNLKNIKVIIDSGLPIWEDMLLIEISRDEKVLPRLLEILDAERNRNKNLITELNVLLSKAHIGLEDKKLNKDGFMQKEIQAFYERGEIGHCFKEIETK